MSDEKNNEGKSTNWAEKIEKEAANEKSNKAHGLQRGAIGDETAGSVKDLSQLKKAAAEQIGKTAVEKYVKEKAPQTRLLRVDEQKQISIDKKDIHLKSTTALTDPDTAKQNLKDASKAKNFGKETPPSRGGGFRGGGSPMMREPDEILKEKNKNTNPEDILSKKSKGGSILLAMNEEHTPATVSRNEKAPQQRFREDPKEQFKEAQEKLEQKQKLQAKSFKPTQGTDVFDRLPKKTGDKDFKPKSATDIFDKKESLQKNVVKSEMPTTTPNKTAKPPKPSGGGQIKR